ncbi:MAG: helix-turn-helix transcriptional regulator [Nocardioidaceae bacterium]
MRLLERASHLSSLMEYAVEARSGEGRLGLRSVPTGMRATTKAHPAGLTRREQEVLELLCSGLTNDEISAKLVVSVKTVDHHVSAVLAKLGVPSRKVAAAEAARRGLVVAAREVTRHANWVVVPDSLARSADQCCWCPHDQTEE